MRAFDNLAPGLYSQNTLLYGVEVKFYSSKVHRGRDSSRPRSVKACSPSATARASRAA